MGDDGSARGRDPEADRLRGNRSWRVESPGGPALQKLYCERTGAVAALVREILIAVARTKTSQRPRARRATERELLALWRERGFDVPRDRTDELPQFGAPDVALFEFVEDATPLWDLLADRRVARDARDDLLRRFAAAWGRRHAEALRTNDARLVQEHGSVRHVLVAGDRLVWIDLEQAFRPRGDVRPLLAKEIAGYLRSVRKRANDDDWPRDVAAIADGHPDPRVLRAACDEYLVPRGAKRLLWAADRAIRNPRRRREKYGALESMDAELRRRGL